MSSNLPNTGTSGARTPLNNSFIGRAPRRGVLIAHDVDKQKASAEGLPRTMEFFINPDQVGVDARAEWTKIAIPGLSHEVQQYSHTESTTLNFNLEWSFIESMKRMRDNRALPPEQNPSAGNAADDFAVIRELSQRQAMLYRHFLFSFTVPMERGRSPSRCMILWPNFLAIICVVNEVNFRFTRWSKDGIPMAFQAGISVTDHRVVFRQRVDTGNYFTRIDQDNGERVDLGTQDIIELGTDILLDY